MQNHYLNQPRSSAPGKVLLDEIVANLPKHYNLSSLIQDASKDAEPRASGGSCDVTFGLIPWADVKRNRQLLSRCPATCSTNDGSDPVYLLVAIKRARAHALNSFNPENREKFIKRYAREIKIWSTLNHDNILRLLGFADENRMFPSLITVWMENGTAKQFLQENQSANIISLTLDVANGLAYLHSRNIIHGDLKAENILVSKAGTGMLADFGISHALMSEEFANLATSSNNVSGTLRWMAVEQFTTSQSSERYSFATDIWAFGMTIYEFLTGNVPFEHIKWISDVIQAIRDCRSPHDPEDPPFHSDQDGKLWEMCKSCWRAVPSKRPIISDIQEYVQILYAAQGITSTLVGGQSLTPNEQQSSTCDASYPCVEASERYRRQDSPENQSGQLSGKTINQKGLDEVTVEIAKLKEEVMKRRSNPLVDVIDRDQRQTRSLVKEFGRTFGDIQRASSLSISENMTLSPELIPSSEFVSPSLDEDNVPRNLPIAMHYRQPRIFKPSCSLSKIPDELIVVVLSILTVKDVISFSSSSRYYRQLCLKTSLLAYMVSLGKAGCEDIAFSKDGSGLPMHFSCRICANTKERSAYLATRESHWRKFELNRNAIRVLLNSGPIRNYELTAGVIFLLGEHGALRHMDLREVSSRYRASASVTPEGTFVMPEVEPHWRYFPAEGDFVDVALALEEHDLMVIVTATPKMHNGQEMREVNLRYLHYSTYEPHTLAKQNTTTVMHYPIELGRCSASMEIAGNYLLLLVSYPSVDFDYEGAASDELYVFNWLSGEEISHNAKKGQRYDGVTFITPTLFVVVNLSLNALELVHILTNVDGSEILCWLRTLMLPELLKGHLEYSSCRGDPNLMGSSPDCIAEYIHGTGSSNSSANLKAVHPHYGFGGYGIQSDPSKAIIIFNLRFIHHNRLRKVAFVVHRSRLAELALESLRLHSTLTEKAPLIGAYARSFNRPWTNATQRFVWGKKPISFGFYRHLTTWGTNTNDLHLNLTFEVNGDGDVVHMSANTKWCDWGPENTRFDRDDEEAPDWITTTAGQRQVSVRRGDDKIVIKDFNPHAIHQHKAGVQQHRTADTGSDRCSVRVVETTDNIPSQFVGEYGYSSLPYVEYVFKSPNRYSTVIIDEERLIGMVETEQSPSHALDIFSLWP